MNRVVNHSEPPAWKCAETDRRRYLEWVAAISRLPLFTLAFGECRDPFRLRIALIWKAEWEKWVSHQIWLQSVNNPWAWGEEPTNERFLKHWASMSARESDLREGIHLMDEMNAAEIVVGKPYGF